MNSEQFHTSACATGRMPLCRLLHWNGHLHVPRKKVGKGKLAYEKLKRTEPFIVKRKTKVCEALFRKGN